MGDILSTSGSGLPPLWLELKPTRAIAAQLSRGTMPPWHADPGHSEFLNDRRLTSGEKETIAKWVAAGAPDPPDEPPAVRSRS